MNTNESINFLLNHKDATVRGAAVVIKETYDRRKKVIDLVQEALSQLRVDMKYLIFDLEATRRERDEARKGN